LEGCSRGYVARGGQSGKIKANLRKKKINK
jgi:hypothetical protein